MYDFSTGSSGVKVVGEGTGIEPWESFVIRVDRV